MIVRNEAAVIERCLRSVRGLIDRWVISDTGSTDGTQELIGAALAGTPGELHERSWVDFGHNRSELMGLAQGKADYLLLLDADMTVSYDKDQKQALGADSYMLRHAEDPEYWVKRLVRGDRRWWYVGATHEYITTDGTDRVENLDAIAIHHHADGSTRPEKFERDLRLLTAELEREPDKARSVFYLAQTLRDLGRVQESIGAYRRRAGMGGWAEEVFYSLYQVGVLSNRTGDRDRAVTALMEAWNYRPSRVEPLYELAWMFREQGWHEAAHMVAARGAGTPVPADALFVHRWIYEWGLLFEYSIAAYWIGQPGAALKACDQLLAMTQLPDGYRDQTQANRVYCIRALGRAAVGNATFTRGRSVDLRPVSSGATGTAGARPGGDELVPRASILARMRQVEGWLTDEEAELLIDATVEVLRRFPPAPAIVEVGSYCGRSTIVLASVAAVVAPKARVHAIDPHEGEVGAADVGTEITDPTFERFRENLARAGVSESVVPIRRHSHEVDWKRPIALLLLDGLHDYRSCGRDFKHFESWLPEGGCVAFHDYGSWPGVTAVVDELESTGSYDRVKRAGSMVVLRRR